MNKPKIGIIGAGISGLSAALWLEKSSEYDVTIFEASSSIGGVVGRYVYDDFAFSTGPKTFLASKSESLLELIEMLNLSSKVNVSDPKVGNRFLYLDNKIRQLPNSLGSLFSSGFAKTLGKGVLTDVFSQKGQVEDESVFSFMSRRFGRKFTENLIDPLITGIYASGLGMSSEVAFPKLKAMEKNYRSLVLGSIFSRNKKSPKTKGLLGIEGGLLSVLEEIAKILSKEILFQHKVVKVCPLNGQVRVETSQGSFDFDKLIFAIPIGALKSIHMPLSQKTKDLLKSFRSLSLVTLQMSYKNKALDKQGFGYLACSKEKADVLGAVFDSCLVSGEDKTRLTVMIGGEHYPTCIQETDGVLTTQASRDIKNHLQIASDPEDVYLKRYEKVIPFFQVHHKKQVSLLESLLKQEVPSTFFIGNYFDSPSVNSCLFKSRQICEEIIRQGL